MYCILYIAFKEFEITKIALSNHHIPIPSVVFSLCMQMYYIIFQQTFNLKFPFQALHIQPQLLSLLLLNPSHHNSKHVVLSIKLRRERWV